MRTLLYMLLLFLFIEIAIGTSKTCAGLYCLTCLGGEGGEGNCAWDILDNNCLEINNYTNNTYPIIFLRNECPIECNWAWSYCSYVSYIIVILAVITSLISTLVGVFLSHLYYLEDSVIKTDETEEKQKFFMEDQYKTMDLKGFLDSKISITLTYLFGALTLFFLFFPVFAFVISIGSFVLMVLHITYINRTWGISNAIKIAKTPQNIEIPERFTVEEKLSAISFKPHLVKIINTLEKDEKILFVNTQDNDKNFLKTRIWVAVFILVPIVLMFCGVFATMVAGGDFHNADNDAWKYLLPELFLFPFVVIFIIQSKYCFVVTDRRIMKFDRVGGPAYSALPVIISHDDIKLIKITERDIFTLESSAKNVKIVITPPESKSTHILQKVASGFYNSSVSDIAQFKEVMQDLGFAETSQDFPAWIGRAKPLLVHVFIAIIHFVLCVIWIIVWSQGVGSQGSYRFEVLWSITPVLWMVITLLVGLYATKKDIIFEKKVLNI